MARLLRFTPMEVGGVALVEGRAPVAGLVALGRLDLHDVRAVVAEDLGAVGAAEHPAQVDHLQSGERAEGRFRAHGPRARSSHASPARVSPRGLYSHPMYPR